MTLIFDFKQSEYDEKYDLKQRWQQRSYEKIASHLHHIGGQAKEYRLSNCLEPLHAHDTIFVNGGRGSGKTVFLKNIENVWNEEKTGSKPKFHFSNIIDPTLLVDHDDFAHVIVATIYNQVSKKISNSNTPEKLRQSFYNDLRKLSESLSNKDEYDSRRGLDKIIKYTSGIEIERLFHQFIRSCCQILDSDAIILLIDDVDMALSRTFEVLEVVRKMLLCPMVIPIVSGDEELYKFIVRKEFSSQIDKKTLDKENLFEDKNSIKISHSENIANSLKSAYLTKIFPQPYRINLETITDIWNEIEISLSDNSKIPFKSKNGTENSYEGIIYKSLFKLVNNEEKSASFPSPENARDVVQLIRLLPPDSIINCTLNSVQWDAVKSWSAAKEHGALLTYALTAKQMIMGRNDYSLLSELLPFSPQNQLLLKTQWAKHNFYNEQIKFILDDDKQDKETNQFLLESYQNTYILRSMPPLEMQRRILTITNKVMLKDKLIDSKLGLLYTYHDYYGFQGARAHKIFFSRAFDLLGTTLIWLLNTKIKIDKKKYKELLTQLYSIPPFYSIHAMNPTKSAFGCDDDDINDDIQYHSVSKMKVIGNTITSLSSELEEWSNNYREKISGVDAIQALPLIHAVFNKVFTQLSFVRKNASDFEDEHLTDMVRRFEYIVINAFATFLQPGNIYKANIAQTKRSSSLREHVKFNDSVLRRNTFGLVNYNTKKAASTSIPSLLLEAIWNHPIFKLSHHRGVINPIGKLSIVRSKTKNQETAKTEKPKLIRLQEFINYVNQNHSYVQNANGCYRYINYLHQNNKVNIIKDLQEKFNTMLKLRNITPTQIGGVYQKIYSKLNQFEN